MPADMYIQKMHSANNQKLGLSQGRPSGGVDLASSDYQRRFLGHASFPVRLSPPPQRGQATTRHDREESTSDTETLSLDILQKRGSPRHRGSAGSTNTSRSTNRGYGHGEGSSSRRMPSGELGLVRQTSGSTDTLPRLSRWRSLGSAGTHKTDSSSGRLPSKSAAWVARHSSVHGPSGSTHRLAQKEGHPVSKGRMDSDSNRVGSRHDQQQPDSPVQLSSHGSPKLVRNGITERVIMPDQHAYCTSPKHTLVVSPRNRPQRVERSGYGELAPSKIAQLGGGGVTVPSNVDLPQNNTKDTKPRGDWHDENDQSESHTPRSALARAEEWGELAADCDEEKPSECQGLTKDALQLLLKLKEDEEVRQLRQRAVARWLNHIPKPPPHIMQALDECEQSRESDQGSTSEGSETFLESVTPRGSREDVPCPAPPQDKLDMSLVDKTLEPVVGQPVECPSVHEEQEVKTMEADGSASSDELVPKPEFEFYNSVDEENLRAELVRSKNCGGMDVNDVSRCRSIDILKTKHDIGIDIDRRMEFPAPMVVRATELGAIPEGESDRESSEVVNDGNPELESIEQHPAKDRSTAGTSKELTEVGGVLRPSRMAAVRWTMTLSSIGEWPGGKADVYLKKQEESQRQPEPDLEIAVDVQERLNCTRETRLNGNLEGIEVVENDNTYPTSPTEGKKDRRLSWYSSEDCDSSRIAVGVNVADGSKSCGSGNRTPTYQSPRSMYSEEFGLKFHVKYTIPEDAVVIGGSQQNDLQSDLAPSHLETRSEPVAVMCDPPEPPTLSSQVPPPITKTDPLPNPGAMTPRPRRRLGFEYSPSGSISENFQLGWEGGVAGSDSSRPKCQSPLYDNDEAASEPPEGTYWLPEFCQKVVLDAEARMDAAETKSEEPEKWHMNPLSNSGAGKHHSTWHHSKSNNCRSCGPSTLSRVRSQSQWDLEQISGDSDPWGWSRRVSERVKNRAQGKSKWKLFKKLKQRGSVAPTEKCFGILSILPGMGTCWRKPT